MATTTIFLGDNPVEVEMTVGPGRTLERLDSVSFKMTGKKVDMTRRSVHRRVCREVFANLNSGDVEFADGEDPDAIYINEEGLAEFDDQVG